MLPVPGLGVRGRFWAGSGRKAIVNGPQAGPKLPEPSARAAWDWILSVASSFTARTGPKLAQEAGPGDRKRYVVAVSNG